MTEGSEGRGIGSAASTAGGKGQRPEEPEISLADVGRILRRRINWIVLTFLAVVGAAALFTFTRTPVWQASALIRVEGRGGELFEDQALLTLGSDDIETEMRVVTTRPILERVADDLDLHLRLVEPPGVSREAVLAEVSLDRGAPTARYEVTRAGEGYRLRTLAPDTLRLDRSFRAGEAVAIPGGHFVLSPRPALAEMGATPPDRLVLATVPFEEAIGRLKGRLEVDRPSPRAQLFRISFRSTNRLRTPRVVNAVVDAFLAQRQSVHRGEARTAVSFLENQTAQIQSQLESAEAELQRFREERQVVALETEAQEQVERLAALQVQRAQVAAERDALTQLLETLDTAEDPGRPNYRSLVAFPTFFRNPTVGTLAESLVEAETERTRLRERWSPSHPGIVALDSTISELEARLGEIGRDYLRSLNDQLASVDAELSRFGSDLESVPGRELQFARLERRVRLLADLHSLLQQRLKEAEITEAVADPSVRVAEAATLPRDPVSPKPRRNLVLAGLLGLLLGVGAAFVREATDDRLHAEEDLETLLGLPVLARIPGGGRGGRSLSEVARATIDDGDSPRAEAFRSLRTTLEHGGDSSTDPRELLVTSPGIGEGKSVTAANLAAALARRGRPTLLVDADLRGAVQHRIFHVDRGPGLTDLLAGEADIEHLVRETDLPGLALVPAGAATGRPAELLEGPSLDAFFSRMRGTYAAIVVDSPPALVYADAPALAAVLGEALLVVRAGHTPRRAARDAIERLRQVGAGLVGLAFNDARPDGRYGRRYGTRYPNGGDGRRRTSRGLVGLDAD